MRQMPQVGGLGSHLGAWLQLVIPLEELALLRLRGACTLSAL